MSEWHFYCERKDPVDLPPAYTFAQAFNYLNENGNSFYILEAPTGDYIQCGGGRSRCTVEVRRYNGSDKTKYHHFVAGLEPVSTGMASIQMTDGVVNVRASEVLDRWQAIQLFESFFQQAEFPTWAHLREVKM